MGSDNRRHDPRIFVDDDGKLETSQQQDPSGDRRTMPTRLCDILSDRKHRQTNASLVVLLSLTL